MELYVNEKWEITPESIDEAIEYILNNPSKLSVNNIIVATRCLDFVKDCITGSDDVIAAPRTYDGKVIRVDEMYNNYFNGDPIEVYYMSYEGNNTWIIHDKYGNHYLPSHLVSRG